MALFLATSGCVQPRLYRPVNIQNETDYRLAFIEFDDQGELWSPSQLFRTTELIKRANQAERRSLVVVFIHGWQNNASPKQEQQEGKSLHGFKQFLGQIAENLTYPITGIYLAWRGKSAHKPFSGLTFWDRRRTATRIASSGAVSEVLSRIVQTANQNPKSRTLLIGHSFGGLLMEQAMLQYLVNSTVGVETGRLNFPIDLVMLINPASSSLRAKQLIEVFARDRVKVYQVDNKTGKRYERPLMVSVTSSTDLATRALYPMGTSLGLIFTRFRTYGSEFCSPSAKQRSFYLLTGGHNKVLHSHVVTAESLPKQDGSENELDLQFGYDPATQQETISFNGRKHRFTMQKKLGALNDTPYWIMNVPRSLIPNHSNIFGVNTIRLMTALVQSTGVLEPDSRTELVHETGLVALGVTVRPTGELIFAERSRRLYALPVGASTPVFLSCLPQDIDPADSIGFFRTGDSITVALNWLIDEADNEKEAKYRTELLNVSLTKGGFRKVKPGRLAGSIRFVAATGDPVSRKLYLATRDGIYVADLSEGRPEPTLLVRIDAQVSPRGLYFDPTKERLFAIDSESGRLYLVDVRAETPQVRLAAEGLGWPADVIVAPTDGRIYVSDTKDKQIWRLECDDVRCTKPEVFSRSDAFRTPARLAAAPDNTLWVTDPKAKKIFALWPDGEIRQTISSLTGETQ
ncbi:MAG: SMP-30/gluconolactonase/LRE family protein [Acidiferrobacterales bacterium]